MRDRAAPARSGPRGFIRATAFLRPGGNAARVFVTGGGGFLAGHLVRDLLARGHEVSVLARAGANARLPEGARAVPGDLTAAGAPLIPESSEIVYHLAAQSNVLESTADPLTTFKVNAMGTARLLDEIRTRKLPVKRFVLASSGQVYGPPFAGRLNEDHATQPRNPYSASKLSAETATLSYGALFNIPVSVLRLFNIYGPGQRTSYVVPSVLSQCLWADTLKIGNPWPVRDFLFVDDAVALFRLAGFRREARGEVFNVGSGTGTGIDKMVRVAARAARSDLKAHVESGRQRKNDFDRLVSDPRKAQRRLGWRPRVSLEDGLKRTAQWMRSQGPGALRK